MRWINSAVTFDDRSALLVLSAKHHATHVRLLHELAARDLDVLEATVRELIGLYRPQLKACQVYAMQFNAGEHCWEFAVSHLSLPRRAPGDEAVRMWLIDVYGESPTIADHSLPADQSLQENL